ncbi:MAG: putative membrane protein [Halieaceae bacterium]|jgi:uncharacterized membrane protein
MSRQGWLLLTLVVSLSLNLLVAGFVIGRGSSARPPGPPPMDWMAQEVAPETRALLRSRMRQQVQRVRPLREDMRRATGAVRRAVGAENFDPEALAAALAEMRRLSADYQALMHENLVALSAELPREQRIALAGAALQRDASADRRAGGKQARPERPMAAPAEKFP